MIAAAYIPARSYSTRLPGKNLREVGGVPLVVRSAQVALEAKRVGLVGQVVADVEDATTTRVVLRENVSIRHRPTWLCEPQTRVIDLVRAWLQDRESTDCPDLVAVLLPTSPLRVVRHLVESRLLLDDAADGVMSVTPFRQDVAYALGEEEGFLRRQFIKRLGVPPCLKHDGTVIWARTSALLRLDPGDNFYALRLRPYLVPPEEAVDVNAEMDLVIAEALLAHREGR